ncbi:MAG: hypothetical protein CMIDDMOC_00309 [Sodalis sp. Fle]|nr:MAG: hypothetical protein CMIDDMOC_00309 [Sodalis sp. Fle]
MRHNRPQSIDSLFGNTRITTLSQIQRHALMLLNLNHAVTTLLPTPLRLWCRVANFRENIIVLETANASWLARLRYEQNQLLSALRAQILPSLSTIDIRINPAMMIHEKSNEKNNSNYVTGNRQVIDNPRKLSPQSAALLRHMAVHSEGKLKKILERLARLAEENTDLSRHRK